MTPKEVMYVEDALGHAQFMSPDGRIVEMIELPSNDFHMATQAHPELKSRPNRPHPLFSGFIKASLEHEEKR